MLVAFLAGMSFLLSWVFFKGASDIYISEGKKKGNREVAKGFAFAALGIFLMLVFLH